MLRFHCSRPCWSHLAGGGTLTRERIWRLPSRSSQLGVGGGGTEPGLPAAGHRGVVTGPQDLWFSDRESHVTSRPPGTCGGQGRRDRPGDGKPAGRPRKRAAAEGAQGQGEEASQLCGGLGRREEVPGPSGFYILRSMALVERKTGTHPARTRPLWSATCQRARGQLRRGPPPEGGRGPDGSGGAGL